MGFTLRGWLRRWRKARQAAKRRNAAMRRKGNRRRERYGPDWDEIARYGDPSE